MTPEHVTGSIIIPANAITAFRKTLSATVNRVHDAIYNLSSDLHGRHQHAETTAYLRAIRDETSKRRRAMYTSLTRGGTSAEMDEYLYVLAATERLLERRAHEARRPTQPTHIDVDQIAPRPTMQDREWRATTPDGITVMTLRTDVRTMTIGTVRAANASTAAFMTPLGATLLDALEGTRWTRGSGGTIATLRGGREVAVLRYGPKGAE